MHQSRYHDRVIWTICSFNTNTEIDARSQQPDCTAIFRSVIFVSNSKNRNDKSVVRMLQLGGFGE
ncbi:hypothetical protein PATSB16_23540 [Pandoraea thiooxydans]|nr:hypothetical protein PATSB16_23540 [Pandoraea thiooxydans]